RPPALHGRGLVPHAARPPDLRVPARAGHARLRGGRGLPQLPHLRARDDLPARLGARGCARGPGGRARGGAARRPGARRLGRARAGARARAAGLCGGRPRRAWPGSRPSASSTRRCSGAAPRPSRARRTGRRGRRPLAPGRGWSAFSWGVSRSTPSETRRSRSPCGWRSRSSRGSGRRGESLVSGMRVLHVDPERAWGGGEVQVVALVRELAQRGHASTVAAHPGGPLARAADAAGARVVSLGVANHFDLRAALVLRRLAPGFDVVHFHTARAHALAPLSRGRGARLVVTRRMDYVPAGGPYVRFLYNRAVAAVTAISEGVPAALIRVG